MRSLAILVSVGLSLFSIESMAQDRQRAKEAFRHGTQAYDFGEYEKALTSFKDAYAQVEEPEILFNIAQCHRQLGQKQEAVRVYRSYLRNRPNASNSGDVREIITKLEHSIAEEAATKSAPPEGVQHSTPPVEPSIAPAAVTPAPTPALLATGASAKPAVYKRWYFWTPIVAVVVGVGVGLAVAFVTPNNASYPTGTMTVSLH